MILFFLLLGVGFDCFAGYLAHGPLEVRRGCMVSSIWSLLAVLGVVLCTSWNIVLGFLGLFGILVRRGGFAGAFLAGHYQHFKAAVWDAWRSKVCFDLCQRQGFREKGGGSLDIAGSLQLLQASHVRDRDKALQKGYPC